LPAEALVATSTDVVGAGGTAATELEVEVEPAPDEDAVDEVLVVVDVPVPVVTLDDTLSGRAVAPPVVVLPIPLPAGPVIAPLLVEMPEFS
jgi:hypothetical protein